MKKYLFIFLAITFASNVSADTKDWKKLHQQHFVALNKVFTSLYDNKLKGKAHDKRYLAASVAAAKQYGVDIIDSLMLLSEFWNGEQSIAFSGVVICLPRKQALARIAYFARHGSKMQKVAARDFTGFIKASDRDPDSRSFCIR